MLQFGKALSQQLGLSSKDKDETQVAKRMAPVTGQKKPMAGQKQKAMRPAPKPETVTTFPQIDETNQNDKPSFMKDLEKKGDSKTDIPAVQKSVMKQNATKEDSAMATNGQQPASQNPLDIPGMIQNPFRRTQAQANIPAMSAATAQKPVTQPQPQNWAAYQNNQTANSTNNQTGTTNMQQHAHMQAPQDYGNAYQQNNQQAPKQGVQMVVNEGITMSGEISACDSLVVHGTMEASLNGARRVEVTQTGKFFGKIAIDEATIAGQFEGDLTVDGRLTVTSTGRIKGTIAYRELQVEAGAVLEGKINTLTDKMLQAAKTATETKTEKPKAKKAKKPEQVATARPAQKTTLSDTELPFGAAAE